MDEASATLSSAGNCGPSPFERLLGLVPSRLTLSAACRTAVTLRSLPAVPSPTDRRGMVDQLADAPVTDHPTGR